MGQKRTPGLYKRGDTWHVDKVVLGRRLCESTGIATLQEAEQYLAKRVDETRQAKVYGVRPKRIFEEAAIKFVEEHQHKRSLRSDIGRLKVLIGYIGNLGLEAIHMGALQTFIEARRAAGIKSRTINHGLQAVRRILNLASTEWMDEHGLTWLGHAPKIKLLAEPDLRKPYPLSWEEQDRLFKELPPHLQAMALFAVNTGCREGEICSLRWEWEIQVPELPEAKVFMVPGGLVKNGEDRLIICNDVASRVVESQKGKHTTHVFTYLGKSVKRMNLAAWRSARKRAGLVQVRVHDLKHTFGRRLRAVNVGFEDRQDLLGHRSGRITTHYSSAELQSLYEAANKVCAMNRGGVGLALLRQRSFVIEPSSRRSPAEISAGACLK